MDAFRHLLVRGLSMLGLRDDRDHRARDRALRTTSSSCCSASSAWARPRWTRPATTLAIFLVGLTAHSLIAVLARAFYALQDTATPVVAALHRRRREHRGGDGAGRPARARRPRGRDRDRRLARDAAPWPCCSSAGSRRSALGHVTSVMLAHPGRRRGRRGGRVGRAPWLRHGVWGADPGFLRLLVRMVVATAAGGLVILAGSLALRIEEPRLIVGVVVDLLRRRGRS